MLKRIYGFLVGSLLALACAGSNVMADDTVSLSLPSDTKFVLQLDLEAFRSSAFGSKIFSMVKEKAMEEIGKSSSGGDGPDMSKIIDMLGFDPFTEIQSVTLAASEFENPEKSLVAIVSMRKTTGNLEGLLLSLPGYSAKDHRGYQIHSASPDDDMHVYGATHTSKSGMKCLLLSPKEDVVTSLLDQMDGESTSTDRKGIAFSSSPGTMLSLHLSDIPSDHIDKGPQANIAKLLENLNFKVSEAAGKIDVALAMTANNDKQAEQLQQMLQGLIAMIGFAQSADPENEELKMFSRFAQDLRANRDGATVNVGASFESEEVVKLIEKEIDNH